MADLRSFRPSPSPEKTEHEKDSVRSKTDKTTRKRSIEEITRDKAENLQTRANKLEKKLNDLKESGDLFEKAQDHATAKQFRDALSKSNEYIAFARQNPMNVSDIEQKWLNLLKSDNPQLKGSVKMIERQINPSYQEDAPEPSEDVSLVKRPLKKRKEETLRKENETTLASSNLVDTPSEDYKQNIKKLDSTILKDLREFIHDKSGEGKSYPDGEPKKAYLDMIDVRKRIDKLLAFVNSNRNSESVDLNVKKIIEGIQTHNHRACWQVQEFLNDFDKKTGIAWQSIISADKVRSDRDYGMAPRSF